MHGKHRNTSRPASSMEHCKFFAKGHCSRGHSCHYAHDTTKVLEPCRFFARGHCERGDLCFYPHIIQPVTPRGKRQPSEENAASFQPKLATVIDGTIGSSLVVCRFFAKGSCKNGDNCQFEHASDSANTHHGRPTKRTCSRSLGGAEVIFGAGAQVSCVNLHADFSAVRITGLTLNSRLEMLQLLLSDLGFSVPIQKFRLKGSQNGRVAVEVKMRDPEFAKNLISEFNEEVVKGYGQDIDIRQIPVGSSAGTLAVNKFQTTSLLCSWKRAVCQVRLWYRSSEAALHAHNILREHGRIMGRKVKGNVYSCSEDKHTCAVYLNNVDPLTRPIHFTSLLHGPAKPSDIVFSEPSHTRTAGEAEDIVKELLVKEGMQSWERIKGSGSSTATAWATFLSREEGIKAIDKLHGSDIDELGCKLSLRHVISFTVSVPVAMLRVLEKTVERWKSNLKSDNAGLEVTSRNVHSGKYATLRISGKDVEAVAEAKSQLYDLLVGTVMETDGTVLWDTYFATTAGLEYLEQLQESNGVYIYRDDHKRRLMVHGKRRRVAAVHETLTRKVRSISESTHTILLTPNLLRRATSGPFQAITARLGKSCATLNIAHQPISIKIKGSAADYQFALDLLHANAGTPIVTATKTSQLSEKTCVICWGEADEPVTIPCLHVYCKDCFINQCSAASDNEKDFPIRCQGDEAKCTHVFSTTSLQNLLPSEAFEQLLESSFKTYIKANSKDLRHCPTPDCSQIYRISTCGSNFDCPNCLASVCVNCTSVSHDGITCADNKDIMAGYVQAFNDYKARHGIRDCPNCNTPIEKISGCNHMTCRGCKGHICWFCMKNFENSQDCYQHMTKEHGGYGL